MKAYSQFLKELPSKKVVFAYGDFQAPTNGHELLIKTVEKVANEQAVPHVIYTSQKTLAADRKAHYLKRMFPEANIKAAGNTLIEAAKDLNKKYKSIILVTGVDQVTECKKLLESKNGKEYNFDTITVVSTGERDADLDTTAIKAAKKGDIESFKESLCQSITSTDAMRLMNELRSVHDLDPIKQDLKIATDWLRESYFRGEIYQIGDLVESQEKTFEVVDRGSNYLVVLDESGKTFRKWLKDIQPSTSNDSIVEKQNDILEATKWSPSDKIKVAKIVAGALGVQNLNSTSNPEQLVNNALRFVRNKPMRPEYVAILKRMLQTAKEVGIDFDEKLIPHKVDEARMSAAVKLQRAFEREQEKSAASRKRGEELLNPKKPEEKKPVAEHIVKTGSGYKLLSKKTGKNLGTATSKAGILKREREVEYFKHVKEEAAFEKDDDILKATNNIDDNARVFDSDISKIKEIDHVIHAYDDKELAFVDHDTGEHVGDVHDDDKKTGQRIEQPATETDEYQGSRYVKEEYLEEGLSRMERIMRKQRFMRTKSKREQRVKIALRKSSNIITMSKRARRLATHMIKTRILRKDPETASIPEKERVEALLKKRPLLVNRLASRLLPKLREVEKNRLRHHKYTK
jgi:hypothetical protein